MIETHAHLYADKFDQDRELMMNRAEEAGVKAFYMPNVDSESIDPMMEVEQKYSNAYATMGLHPCSVGKNFEKELYLVEDWLSKRSFKAVGEIGLDYYWDTTYKQQQVEAFKIQIDLAKNFNLPIIIHCRDSFEDCFHIVEELKDERLKGVFHCFSGSASDAKKILDLDFFIGIGGIVTFKNGGLAEQMSGISLENVVLETDAPYLAPAPNRGKRNEPSFLSIIAQKIADLKEMSLEEVKDITDKNALNLFNEK